MNTIRLFLFTVLLFTMSAFALGETLLRSAARRRLNDITLTLTLTLTAPEGTTGAGAVRMTGPWWSWDPDGGPVAADNGDGTWTVTFDPVPDANMEYLWVVDGVQEDLIGKGGCAPITDGLYYANRQWVVDSGDVADTYDSCVIQEVQGCMDATATNYNPDANVDDGSCVYSGCMDATATNYNPVANVACGGCCEYSGCMDATATNYNPDATMGCGGCCEYSGCMDVNAWNYDPDATMGCGGCCVFIPAAPVPTDAANSVLSVFSTTYGNLASTDFNPDWSQATQVAVGDNLVYTGLNYQGTDITSSDVSGYAYIRLDIYTTDATDFQFTIISPGAENLISLTDQIVPYQWVTVQIPLSNFGVDLTAVNQLKVVKVDGNGQVAFNNIYFGGVGGVAVLGCMDATAWNYDPVANVDDGSCVFIPAAPVPTDPANSVLSVFSTTYGNLASTDFNPGWGQATQVTVGDNLVYTGLNYQGTDITSSDVSGYAYIRLDIYTTDASDFQFTIISPGAENLISLTDQIVPYQWVTVQIPLSNFGVDLTAVNQLKVVKVDGNGQVAFNNIYFGGVGGVAVLGCMDATATNYNPDANVACGGCCVYGNYVTYCATEVTHFNIDNHLYPILLTVEKSGDNSMTVTATSVNDVIDVLIIENVRGGGTVSATTIANGVATAEIAWSNMPAATSFGMLWSDETSLDNSMLKVGDGPDGLGNIDTSNVCEVYGCTDPLATNYDSAATVDDDSCTDTGGTGATIALPVDFEEAADAYKIDGFDGGVASVEAGPDGDVSLKYVKGAGQQWAGVWINLDTAVDAANGEILTVDVHSTVARDITLKFDAAGVQRTVSHSGSGWEALSYDFTGAMPAGQTKIVFFNDLTQEGDGSADWTIYIDNLAQTTDTGGDNGGGTQLTITTTVCETASNVTASNVRIFGPWWDWDPNGGPVAEDNGDGTWTFTFDPAPTDNMEYKLLVDGVQEDLIGKGGCAPINGSTFANRQWIVGSGDVTNTYGTCGNCDDLVDEPDTPAPDTPARIVRPKLDDKWHLQIECIDGLQNCWANGEKQHYTDRLENAYVSDGHLHIVAKKEKEEYVSQGVERSYTSARLNSKYDFKYGTVKVRAKLPKQKGLWPAIWTLGSNINEVGVHDFGRSPEVAWPACGEIDIIEQYGTQNFVGSAMHGPSPVVIFSAASAPNPWNTGELSPSVDEFHVYSMEWTAEKIIFKVDEDAYKTVTAPSDKTNWPFDHKHFLLLNVAVEGITHKTGFIANDFVSGEMVVDYVRIYGEDGDLNWSDEFGGVLVSDCPGLKEAFQANCDCGVEYTSSGSLASVVSASDCSGLKKAYKENCDCSQ